jgi:hypothetical protein
MAKNKKRVEARRDDDDSDFLKEARERFERIASDESDERVQMLDDIKFQAGEQWPEKLRADRERGPNARPCLVVDKLSQYHRQVVNDSRQNRPGAKIRPVDSQSDPKVADLLQGLVRGIEDASNADTAYDTAISHAAGPGRGWIRVCSEYSDPESFQQELRIKRVPNIFSVYASDYSEPDGSDIDHAFVVEEIDEDEFEDRFPDAEPVDWKAEAPRVGDWYANGKVRVAEYWYTVREKRLMHLLEDGSVVTDEEVKKAIEEGVTPPAISESRRLDSKRVKFALISGAQVLERRDDWPGRFIPLVPVHGNEIWVEGQRRLSGLIRAAKDPQRLYNFSRSAFAERVALSPKAPWLVAEGQIEGYEDQWATANTANHSHLPYKPVDLNGQAVPPPTRLPAADVPSGFAQDMQLAEHDIQAAVGMYAASLGAPSNEKSGKAILARQREGDMSTFHYHDNLAKAQRHVVRILLDLIPAFYDTRRVVRILGEDGTHQLAQIDPKAKGVQSVGAMQVFNPGAGRYDVTITTGPSYSTKRQEAAEYLTQMVQQQPNLMQIGGDIVFRALDMPYADELAERMKLLLPPQIAQAEQQKKMAELPAQVQQAMQMADQAIAEAEAAKNDNALKQAEIQLKFRELQVKEAEVNAKLYAEQARLSAPQPEPGTGNRPANGSGSGVVVNVPVSIRSGGEKKPLSNARAVPMPDGSFVMQAEIEDDEGDPLKAVAIPQADGTFVLGRAEKEEKPEPVQVAIATPLPDGSFALEKTYMA